MRKLCYIEVDGMVLLTDDENQHNEKVAKLKATVKVNVNHGIVPQQDGQFFHLNVDDDGVNLKVYSLPSEKS